MIKDWFNKIYKNIQTSDNKPLEDKITKLTEEKTTLEKDNNTLKLRNIELNKEIIKEKKKFQDLLNSDNLDINSLRSWYEGRREQERWVYDGRRLGRVDVKRYLYVKKEDEPLMFEAAQTIIDKYKLTNDSEPHVIVSKIMKYFILRKNWTYMYDKDKHNETELWQYAPNSWKERTGDCDDLAILMHVLWDFILRKLGLTKFYWRLTFTTGLLLGEGGHAFNTYLHNDGNYYCVESTYDLNGSFHKTWLKTKIKDNNLYVRFFGFATKDKSWVGSTSALKKYSNR